MMGGHLNHNKFWMKPFETINIPHNRYELQVLLGQKVHLTPIYKKTGRNHVWTTHWKRFKGIE